MSKREQVLCDCCGNEIEVPEQMVMKPRKAGEETIKVDVRVRRSANGNSSEIELDVCGNCIRFYLEPENA